MNKCVIGSRKRDGVVALATRCKALQRYGVSCTFFGVWYLRVIQVNEYTCIHFTSWERRIAFAYFQSIIYQSHCSQTSIITLLLGEC